MKYIKTYERYTHTPQDKIDDMTLLQEFTQKFEDKFEYRLNLDTTNQPEFRSYLGFGADKNYSGTIEVYNNKYYKTKKKIRYSIVLETDINPAGITGDDDIGRTFTIDFDIKQENRLRNKFPDFRQYTRDIDTLIEKFDDYVRTTLNIKKLSEEELKQKQIDKSANKYNL